MTWFWPIGLGALLALAGWVISARLVPSGLASRARRLRRDRPVAASLQRWLDGVDCLIARLLPSPNGDRRRATQALARQAGWHDPAAAARLDGAGWLLPPLAALVAVLGQGPSVLQAPLRAGFVVALAAAAGHFAPRLYAANRAMRRRQAAAQGLPDALDLLVICAESGLGIEVALARSARELAPAQPILAAELAMTATELGLLPNRADAFANLARRLPVPQVIAVSDMLVQTERFGTPLAQSLRTLAAEVRSARLLRAEEAAAKLPALMTVPMIAFILPPLFIVLIGPAIIGALVGGG